jgi:hypothetical protein
MFYDFAYYTTIYYHNAWHYYTTLSNYSVSALMLEFYMRVSLLFHQMTHLSSGGGFIGDPTAQLYAFAKSSLFISGPLTLQCDEMYRYTVLFYILCT